MLITATAAVHAVVWKWLTFICPAILTSCWHQDCWHQLATPVRAGGIWQEAERSNYESGRRHMWRGLKGDRQPHSTVWSQLAWTYRFYLSKPTMKDVRLKAQAHDGTERKSSSSSSWNRFHCGLFIFVDLSAKQWDFGSPNLQKQTTWLCEFQPLKRG